MFTVGPTFFSRALGDHPEGDGLTRLQTTFAGASAADISGFAVPHTIGGAAGSSTVVVHDGYLEVYNMAVAATAGNPGCSWDDNGIARVANGAAHTVEWFMSLESYPTARNGTGQTHIYLNNLTSSMQGGSNPFQVRTNGGYANTQWGSSSANYGGSQLFDSFTPTLLGLRRHFAFVWQTDNTCSFYCNGVRVFTFTDTSYLLGAPTPAIRFGSPSVAFYWTDVVVRYYGLRVRRAAMYTGASFTPPASPAVWGPP